MASIIDITKGRIRTYDLLEHLINDIHEAYELLHSERNSQFLRRVVVRCVFSFIESNIQIIKHELKNDVNRQKTTLPLSEKQKEILYEEKAEGLQVMKVLIPIHQNFKETYKLAYKLWDIDLVLNTNDLGYKAFLSTKHTRNRLTHPKTFYDIEITELDMENITSAFLWAKEEFLKIFEAKTRKIKALILDAQSNIDD